MLIEHWGFSFMMSARFLRSVQLRHDRPLSSGRFHLDRQSKHLALHCSPRPASYKGRRLHHHGRLRNRDIRNQYSRQDASSTPLKTFCIIVHMCTNGQGSKRMIEHCSLSFSGFWLQSVLLMQPCGENKKYRAHGRRVKLVQCPGSEPRIPL